MTLRLSLVIVVLLLLSPSGHAESERATLRGLAGVKLVVEIDAEFERVLTVAAVRREAEGFFRQRGIALLADSQWSAAPGRPVLKLEVDAEPGPEGTLAYSVTLELEQDVRLARDPSMAISAPTWSATEKLGVIRRQDAGPVRDAVRELLESFARAYTEMNGKR